MHRRSPQQATDTRATGILRDFVADWAAPVEHQGGADFGTDVTLEIFARVDGRATRDTSGISFQIQLKGTESPRYTDDSIAFDFKISHLESVLLKEQLPFFLVVIDTSAKRGFYLFLQEWAREHWASIPKVTAAGKRRKTVRIHIPLTNEAHDFNKFENAVRLSNQKMKEYFPGPSLAAVTLERQRLEAADPRVSVKVDVSSSGEKRISVMPKESFTFSIAASGDPLELQRFNHDFIGRGKEVSIKDYGIKFEVTGLPLLPDATLIQKVQFLRTATGSARLVRIKNDLEQGSVDLQGTWQLGNEEGILKAAVGGDLLSVTVRLHAPVQKTIAINLDVQFRFEHWFGKDVGASLNYYDQIGRLLRDYGSDDSLRLEMYRDGNLIGAPDISPAVGKWGVDVAGAIHWIDKLRHIAKVTHCNLTVPEGFQDRDYWEVERAHQFLLGNEVPIAVSHGSVTLPIGKNRWSVGDLVEDGVRFPIESTMLDVLGKRIDFGPSDFNCEPASIRILGIENDEARTEFVPAATAKITVRQRVAQPI